MKQLGVLPRSAAILLLLAVAFSLPGAGTQEKSAAKSGKAQRDKLLKLDADLRAAFGKTGNTLPESKRALPDASAPAFDWVPVLGLTPVHQQGGKPNCVAQATVAALEWNWQLRNGTRTKPILSPQPILDRLQKGGALR